MVQAITETATILHRILSAKRAHNTLPEQTTEILSASNLVPVQFRIFNTAQNINVSKRQINGTLVFL